jgi:hypothetical protein
MQQDDEPGERPAAVAVDADMSAGEYLASDDRSKAHGYNHVPHRPGHPDVGRQRDEARRGERRREEDAPA